jgi:predicted glutamine amidotransferase
MCRVLGCVAAEPVSLRHELLDAENPLIRQSEHHDSGWGMSVYPRGDGEGPHCSRFPEAAFSGDELAAASELSGRIFNVHVRRATFGGLALENTHPFCLGSYSFSHNGSIVEYTRLLDQPGVAQPSGATDSEAFFNLMMRDFDPERAIESLRRAVELTIELSPFSGLNFLLCDGERLYAYRLGVFELHWLARPGQLLVASERLTDERWHDVRQDVLLVCDPRDPEEPHAERLVGDAVVARARIDDFNEGSELRGRERGEFAARRAARLAATTGT